MKILLILFAFALSVFSYAQTTPTTGSTGTGTGLYIVSVVGAYETVDMTNVRAVKLYTGLTDTVCSAPDANAFYTCDSCATLTNPASAPFVCSKTQMDPNGNLAVIVRSSTVALFSTGTPAFKVTYGSAGTTITFDTAHTSTTFAANTDLTLSIPWNQICSSLGASGCTKSISPTDLTISITNGTTTESVVLNLSHRYATRAQMIAANPSSNNGYMTFSTNCTNANTYELICGYKVFPGDEKAFVLDPVHNDVNTTSAVPSLDGTNPVTMADVSGQKYKYIRLFYRNDNFAAITPASGYANIDWNVGSNTLGAQTISDLSNDVEYFFEAASVDQGGITSFFADPASLNPTTSANLAAGTYFQSATPGPVYGLLEGNKCFIATAAYGTEMAPQIEWLRKFRNKYLLNNKLGLLFVRTYYKYSPPIADFIAKHEWIRMATRWALTPVVEASEWLMKDSQ